jgi:TPR repeat protein
MQTQLKEAYDTLLAKEYDKAFARYSTLAEQKEPTSFYYLGFLYFRGFGVAQEPKRHSRTILKLLHVKSLSHNLKQR